MKKAYRGQKKISELIEVASLPAAKRFGFAMFKIITNWEHIVGLALAKTTTPKGITFQQNKTMGGVLNIEVENPGFSLELQASEAVILQKIAVFFGYNAVDRIKVSIARVRKPIAAGQPSKQVKIMVSPAQSKLIRSSVDKIADDELKLALASIAEQLFTSSPE